MSKFKNYVDYVILFFVFITFVRTCGISNKVEKNSDEIESIKTTLTEIKDQNVTQEELINILETTTFWQTLRVEEISDKEKISINALEAKDKINK
jgi:hypothetical protein